MEKFSKNVKLNKVLNYIFEELQELGTEEVLRYKKEFPNVVDFNLYQYGNLTIYNYDIEQIYKNAGYISKFDYVDAYKRQVGYLVRNYFN